MGLANGIRKHGFRSWHERELLGSHGWLVVTLLSALAAFGSLEMLIDSRHWTDRATHLLVMAASGLVVIFALRRFLYRLVCAQRIASQATCHRCETFGRLLVVGEDRAGTWVRVRCMNCGHEWAMDDPCAPSNPGH